MTSLTDRYIWAVVRTTPEKSRPELEQEVRALVADATDAHLDAGSRSAERDALVELGDPQVLAASYADRPLMLIGPQYYLVWLRLLKLLLAIVLPIATIGIGIGQLVDGAGIGEIIGAMVSGAIGVAVNLCFWVTAVFALIDRTMGGKPMMEWTPEQLPELPSSTRGSALSELIASVAFLGLLLVALVWQHFNPFLSNSDGSLPVLNPELWNFWIPWFIALTAAEIAFAFAVYLRGWSTLLAGVNVVLNLAFAIPAIWLFVNGLLLNPAFVDALAAQTDDDFDEAWRITSMIIVVAVVVIAAWDVIDGCLKTYRARHPRLAPTGMATTSTR
jgi:hypothetical protein